MKRHIQDFNRFSLNEDSSEDKKSEPKGLNLDIPALKSELNELRSSFGLVERFLPENQKPKIPRAFMDFMDKMLSRMEDLEREVNRGSREREA